MQNQCFCPAGYARVRADALRSSDLFELPSLTTSGYVLQTVFGRAGRRSSSVAKVGSALPQLFSAPEGGRNACGASTLQCNSISLTDGMGAGT